MPIINGGPFGERYGVAENTQEYGWLREDYPEMHVLTELDVKRLSMLTPENRAYVVMVLNVFGPGTHVRKVRVPKREAK